VWRKERRDKAPKELFGKILQLELQLLETCVLSNATKGGTAFIRRITEGFESR
jgi:hypothetical protein